MRLSRSPTNQEWEEIGEKYKDGGVHMYRGKRTYFYNGGEILWDGAGMFGRPLIYNQEERSTWEVIIVLPGIEIIPVDTFLGCRNVNTVIMTDTVKRIERRAFLRCGSLEFVKLSTNLEYIGHAAFSYCESLTSIFIPPSCREIDNRAFNCCEKLIIFSVPRHTTLRADVIADTALIEASPFKKNYFGNYADTNEVNEWIRNRHADNQLSLHRVCSSFNPSAEVIFNIVKVQGPRGFKTPDSVGVTPSQYLSQNPHTKIKEQKIMKRYMLDMMGEVI